VLVIFVAIYTDIEFIDKTPAKRYEDYLEEPLLPEIGNKILNHCSKSSMAFGAIPAVKPTNKITRNAKFKHGTQDRKLSS
jgi:hypothetical protein